MVALTAFNGAARVATVMYMCGVGVRLQSEC